MNTRRRPARRVEDNDVHEEIHPQVEQVAQDGQGLKSSLGAQVPPQGGHVPNGEGGNEVLLVHPDLTNQEIREAWIALARAMTTQANLSLVPRVNIVESTMISRLRDFLRTNPLIFIVYKVGEDPEEFLEGVYKVLSAMVVKSW